MSNNKDIFQKPRSSRTDLPNFTKPVKPEVKRVNKVLVGSLDEAEVMAAILKRIKGHKIASVAHSGNDEAIMAVGNTMARNCRHVALVVNSTTTSQEDIECIYYLQRAVNMTIITAPSLSDEKQQLLSYTGEELALMSPFKEIIEVFES